MRPVHWPVSPARPVATYGYPPALRRWPELPDMTVDEPSEPRIDGASAAERLRREHESGW